MKFKQSIIPGVVDSPLGAWLSRLLGACPPTPERPPSRVVLYVLFFVCIFFCLQVGTAAWLVFPLRFFTTGMARTCLQKVNRRHWRHSTAPSSISASHPLHFRTLFRRQQSRQYFFHGFLIPSVISCEQSKQRGWVRILMHARSCGTGKCLCSVNRSARC